MPNKIRVLLTVPDLCSTGSPYRETMAIAKYLPREQYDLTICSLRDNGVADTVPLLDSYGVRHVVARFRNRGKSLSRVMAALRDQKSIDRTGPYDIQHSLDFTPSPLEAMLAKLKSRHYLYNQRNLNENGSRTALRAKIRLSDRIVAISEPVLNMLLAKGTPPEKVRKIYLGIDIEECDRELSAADGGKSPTILSVGHLVPRKRHEDAIRAFAMIAPEFPQLKLQIAGHPDEPAYADGLRRLAHELGVAEKVDFAGTRRDVLNLMKQAEALLLCSESEAFGWVLLEAMVARLPIIASAVDGPKEVIEDGRSGILVLPGDVEGYADALRAVLNNRAFSASLTSRAREAVEQKFSAPEMVRKTAALYSELCQ